MLLASQLSVSGILGLCIEVDPVVHEPLYPLDGVACEAECDVLSAFVLIAISSVRAAGSS